MPRFFNSFSLMMLLLMFSCIHVPLVSGKCLSDQKTLLLELRDNLTYDSTVSTKLVEWNNQSNDCCFWEGVSCDSSGHVVGLDLSGEAISGGINESSSLFGLRFLERLNLAENYLDSVQVPSNFEKLNSLSYLNLSDSGFVGQIPSGFSKLTSLVTLDLSVSSISFTNYLQIENPNLEFLVRNLTRLRELYLDGMNLSAIGYDWCRALSSSVPDLHVLSLSNCYLSGPIDYSLAKLKSLSVILLDQNSFSGEIPEFFGDFPNLTVLSLAACMFSGVIPQKIFQVPTLQTIDLSSNGDLGGSLPDFPEDSSLQNLLLGETQFSGSLPNSIGNLKMLSQLALRNCNFTGPVPSSVENLTHLVSVDLSLNHFNGSVPSFLLSRNLTTINLRANKFSGNISFFQGVTLDNLSLLDLSDNSIEGKVPESLFFMPSLTDLTLSNNKFSGQISEPAYKQSSKLGLIDLTSNNLEGPLPQFLFDLQNLTTLKLSWNQFNGTLELTDFGKLPQLDSLDLSYNKLVVDTNRSYSERSVLPQFQELMLASCGITNFPFLKNQSRISMLDLSNNHIAGEIPSWLWEVGVEYLRFLNLSHNQLTHIQEPYIIPYLDLLDLHSNSLGGKLPTPSGGAVFVDFSSNNFVSSIPTDIGNKLLYVSFFSIANNKVEGSIPESFCNASRLKVLDLSNNTLSNTIPPCLLESSNNLGVLNLGRNNLSGQIPEISFSNCSLKTFDLGWNHLEGGIPESLSNCSDLKVLNLGNNRLDDNFPCWINTLTNLHVLVLRNNHFQGSVTCPGNSYIFPNLQIVDISVNSFSGDVPMALFSGLKAMINEDTQLDLLRFNTFIGNQVYYQNSVPITLKGLPRDLETILTIFTYIDFSSNHFQGTLPETIGVLQRLHLLNFSHNALAGPIPLSIGNLKQLESLDLSFNRLNGEIPGQISGLTFLSFLNLAYNQLVGMIPGGGQMQTFTESSFRGNGGLCGFPLNITCTFASPPKFPAPATADKDEWVSGKDIYISAAIGFAVSLIVFYGSIFCNKKWRKWYNDHLDRFILKILCQEDKSTWKETEKDFMSQSAFSLQPKDT